MEADSQVIALLNEVLKAALTASNQCSLHANICEKDGCMQLARYLREESVAELTHAESLMERILYLGGTPVRNELFPLRTGQYFRDRLQNDLQLGREAVLRLNRGIALCRSVGDTDSQKLLASILTAEEQHVDWLEAQAHMIQEIGLENYLAQQIEDDRRQGR